MINAVQGSNWAAYSANYSPAQAPASSNLASTTELPSEQAVMGAQASVLRTANEQGSEMLKVLGNILDIKA